MGIGARLVAERSRLGLTQEALGQIGGVARNAQANYESDKRLPDAGYLAAAAEVGVDVLFVVTGRRSAEMDATLFGMCEAGLRDALIAARPSLGGNLNFRPHQICKIYNAVVKALRPDDDVSAAVCAAAERAIAWADDPSDPSQLARVLLRTAEPETGAIPKGQAGGVTAGDGAVVSTGRSVMANGPGAVAVGRGVHYHGESTKKPPKK